MDIQFTKRIAKLFNNRQKLIQKHGDRRAKKIIHRLNALRAAPNLLKMQSLPGRCHELVGDRAGQLSLDLDHPHRLIFEPAHDPIPRKEDGGLDWANVTIVRILGVEDTHE